MAYENLIKLYVNHSLTIVQTTNSIKPINDNLNMSQKNNNKRINHYTDSKTNKSIKNPEDTKKWLSVQLTTFTVSYRLSKVWQHFTSRTNKIIRLFVYHLASVNNVFSRNYAMYMAHV